MAKDAATTFEAYTADFQKTFTDGAAQYTAKMGEVAEFAKGNIDAFFASAAKATESAHEMTEVMLGMTQSSIDANVAALKELSSVKDPSEFVEKQTALAKSSMEQMSESMNKLNEMAMAAMKHCAEPMNARFTAIGEIVKDGGRRG